MSRKTLETHWGKHHRAYVSNLNAQLSTDEAGLELKRLPLKDLVTKAYNNGDPFPCFNNAAQAWNHEFFWSSLSPPSGQAGTPSPSGGERRLPQGELLQMVERDFGSYEAFEAEFKKAAGSQFGSGWVWLSAKVQPLVPEEWQTDMRVTNPYRLTIAKLVVETTPNALNPLIFGRIPLMTLDVWEHAYYLDYQNRRPEFINTFFQHLVNWDVVSARLEEAKAVTNFHEPKLPDLALEPVA